MKPENKPHASADIEPGAAHAPQVSERRLEPAEVPLAIMQDFRNRFRGALLALWKHLSPNPEPAYEVSFAYQGALSKAHYATAGHCQWFWHHYGRDGIKRVPQVVEATRALHPQWQVASAKQWTVLDTDACTYWQITLARPRTLTVVDPDATASGGDLTRVGAEHESQLIYLNEGLQELRPHEVSAWLQA